MTDPSGAPQPYLQPPVASSGRKGSKKVRTGCVTVRKVKCDEAKPACLRCTKTGRICDGYLPRKPAHGEGSPGSDIVARLSPSVSPYADWVGGTREQRAFDFYRNFSAPAIFSDGGGGLTLWKKLVPHFCHAEPAIRHAVLAISSLHESLSQETSADSASGDFLAPVRRRGVVSNTFAAEQYGKALKCLQEWKPSESATVTVPLLACLLFICIEFMLGDEKASQVHINQGRLILAQLDTTTAGSDVDVIKKHFVPIYSRLSLASFLFGTRPAEIPSNLRSSSATNKFFASVDEAEVALYELVDDGLRFSNKARRTVYMRVSIDPDLQTLQREQEDILARFNRWHIAFTVVAALEDAKKAGKLCSVYYHTGKIWVGTAMSPFETAYDDHIASFAAIISLCSELIHASKKSARDPSKAAMSTPKFVFDTEIIPPLYYTVAKCRHPMLRRAAADLLTQDAVTNRRENLWDARMMAEIGRRIMTIEENSVRRDTSDLGTTNWDARSCAGSDECADQAARAPGFVYEIAVPYMQYPGLTRDAYHHYSEQYQVVNGLGGSRQTSPGSVSTKASTGSSSSGSNTSWGSGHLETPFNLPEYARVKNAQIDNESLHGSWVTVFMDPEEAGAQHWKVTKEFVRVK
ncbi:hypothetical protein CkaCkLH20_02248 [Colletotrichum karsti]|uniref:Zn(2)-C6 fungal-type domain-containing protein n=1 Tax=Colletotrichum karsti TaxID=1095194 RepID=A0A9P6ICH4_9PEZI|nr:uncharacterized protein CkaCkLH20_02248 [Colletotrichum karsti]KAF9880294.1 hypothetical protein CkaCkLH20_02248 [Colletotrichum karsti]